MSRLSLATTTAAVLATLTMGSTAAANCARPVSYTPKVTGNKVVIEANNFSNRGCPDSPGMLRQDVASKGMVQLADFCVDTGHSDSPKAYVDECVAAGKYLYGFSKPYACVSSACSTDYYVEVTVTDPLPANCTRSSGNSAPKVVNSPPWTNKEICSYQPSNPIVPAAGGSPGAGGAPAQAGAPAVAGAAGGGGAPSSSAAAGTAGIVAAAGAGGSAGAAPVQAGAAGIPIVAPASGGRTFTAPPTGGVPVITPAPSGGSYGELPAGGGGVPTSVVAVAGAANTVAPQGGQTNAPALAKGGATVAENTTVSAAAHAGASASATAAAPANDSDSGCSIVAPTGTSSVLGLNALAILVGLLLRRGRREKSVS